MYFGDDDAIYVVIIQQPVWKWHHNYKTWIQQGSIRWITTLLDISNHFHFRQINRAYFSVSVHIAPSIEEFVIYGFKYTHVHLCWCSHLFLYSLNTFCSRVHIPLNFLDHTWQIWLVSSQKIAFTWKSIPIQILSVV